METAKPLEEGSSKQVPATASSLKVYSKKKKKQPVVVHAERVELSDDEDTLTLSELGKIRHNAHCPITPMKGEQARLTTNQNLEKEKAESRNLRKAQWRERKKQLLASQIVDDHTASVEATMVIPDTPYAHYTQLLGQNCDVTIRVVRWWKGKLYGPNSPETIVFLAVDDKGFTLQGYVPPYLARRWNISVLEDCVYRVSEVQIVPHNTHTQLVEAPIQLQPTEKTLFEMLPPEHEHPHVVHVFTKLSLLPTFASNHSVYKDLLAIVIDIRPTVTKLTRTKDRVTEFAEAFLTDATIYPRCIPLTLWPEALAKYQIFSVPFTFPFLLQATGLKPNVYRGNYGFQTTTFTCLEFEHIHRKKAKRMLKRIIKLKNRLADQSPCQLPFSEVICDQMPRLYTIAEYLQACKKKPAQDELQYYTILASIVHIHTDLPTTYRACVLCNTTMRDEQYDSYGCTKPGCTNQAGRTAYRYKLIATIRDSSGTLDITVFNSPAEEILKTPAPVVREWLLEDDDGPAKVDSLLQAAYSKTFKFCFRVNSASFAYTDKGTYTLHQLEWTPMPLSNPEEMLAQLTSSPHHPSASTSALT